MSEFSLITDKECQSILFCLEILCSCKILVQCQSINMLQNREYGDLRNIICKQMESVLH